MSIEGSNFIFAFSDLRKGEREGGNNVIDCIILLNLPFRNNFLYFYTENKKKYLSSCVIKHGIILISTLIRPNVGFSTPSNHPSLAFILSLQHVF